MPTQAYIAGLTTGGNPEIRPELADTTTIGVVWQPDWAEDFNLSVDLYDIEIQDAIAQLGAQEILDRCYLQGAQDICALISRNDTGTPFIRQILNVFINIAETKTSGIDIETSWRKDLRIFGGDESIGLRFFANYLDEVSSQFVGVAPLNEAGELAYPEWLATWHVHVHERSLPLQLADALPRRDDSRRLVDRGHRHRGQRHRRADVHELESVLRS